MRVWKQRGGGSRVCSTMVDIEDTRLVLYREALGSYRTSSAHPSPIDKSKHFLRSIFFPRFVDTVRAH